MSETAVADPLSLARDLILRPSGLDDRRPRPVFGEVLAHSVDFADLYFQLAHQESWSLEDGIVKDGSASIEQGVGRARARRREDRLRLLRRDRAAGARGGLARRARHRGARRRAARAVPGARRPGISSICRRIRPPRSPPQDKVAWLERVDREARRVDPRVVHVTREPRGGARGRADRHQRRGARRGRAPAGALQRFGAGRAERPARAGLRRRRRALLAGGAGGRAIGRSRSRAKPCARRWSISRRARRRRAP